MQEHNDGRKVVVNDQELRLIQMIREIRYGELYLYIADGKPIRAEEIRKSVKL